MAKGRAPGKVIICGEHAVVHGSPALAAALGIYTEAETTRGKDDKVRLILVDVELSFEWSLESIAPSLEHLIVTDLAPRPCGEQTTLELLKLIQNYSLSPEALSSGVMAFLFLYGSIVGMKPGTVRVESKLPIGAGLGSSAAFSVAIAASLLAFTRQLSTGASSNEGKGWISVFDEDAKLINDWAFQAEKIIHGNPSGIDNTVSSFGKVVKVEKNAKTFFKHVPTFKTLITDTKVPRSTKQLVANVGLLKDRHPRVMSAVFQAVSAVSEEFLAILNSGTRNNVLNGNGDCAHKSEQESQLEELFAINQALLQAMGVSHPSIQSVCDITAKYNLKSKLTGAGGGGCVISFIPENFPDGKLSMAKAELTSAGFQCFEAKLGSEGAQVSY